MVTTLTIYTDRFDSRENICGNGMSGKVFLESYGENSEDGTAFSSVDEALDYCIEHKMSIDQLVFMYLSEDGNQKFMRFNTLKNEYGK